MPALLLALLPTMGPLISFLLKAAPEVVDLASTLKQSGATEATPEQLAQLEADITRRHADEAMVDADAAGA